MKNHRIFKRQQGVALVFSLVMLVSLTLVGVTAMHGSRTELAMAGNQREAGLMFQAAEAGLVSAERFIIGAEDNDVFNDPNKGLVTILATGATAENDTLDYFDRWVVGGGATAADISIQSGEQPLYKIEYLGDRSQNPGALVNIGLYDELPPGDIVSIYRSTARGVGLTGNAYRYVQSYYGKEAF